MALDVKKLSVSWLFSVDNSMMALYADGLKRDGREGVGGDAAEEEAQKEN